MKRFLTLALTCLPLLCFGATTYTTYFNNTHTYTNATVVGTNFAGRGVFTNGITAGPPSDGNNAITLAGSTTNNPVTITASGSNTNIPIQMVPFGTNGMVAIGPLGEVSRIRAFHEGALGSYPNTPIDFLIQNRMGTNGWAGATIASASQDSTYPYIELMKARGVVGSPAAVQVNDYVGEIAIAPYDGAGYRISSSINFRVTDSISTGGIVPGRIEMRNTSAGGVLLTNWVVGWNRATLDVSSGMVITNVTTATPFTIYATNAANTTLGNIKNFSSTGAAGWRGTGNDDHWAEYGRGGSGRSDLLDSRAYFLSQDTGVVIGSLGASDPIIFIAGGVSAGNEIGRISSSGIGLPKTITAAGTTGNQTINKPSGSVNFAAAAQSITVTCSLVDANSIIMATVATDDATAKSCIAVPGTGSFVLKLNAAATAETRVQFLITN